MDESEKKLERKIFFSEKNPYKSQQYCESRMVKKVALSIAGSDSSAGAGIQADLKSFSYLGVYGTTAITCITSQNTQQVRTIYKVPVDVIEQQIETLFDDFTIAAVKTGMLFDEEIVHVVARQLRTHHLKPVVDPVMVATSGDALSNHTFLASLKKELLPHAYMVTANVPETCRLTDMKITKLKDLEKAAKDIFELGPEYVVVKGGHLQAEMVTDLLYDGKQVLSLHTAADTSEKGARLRLHIVCSDHRVACVWRITVHCGTESKIHRLEHDTRRIRSRERR